MLTPTGLLVLAVLVPAEAARPPLLAGPTVTPRTETEGAWVFNASARPRPAAMGPHRWARLLRQLELDEGQRAEVEAIVAAFRKAVSDFRAEHGDRLDALSAEAKSAREAGRVLPEPQLLELQDLRRNRPKGVECLRRIWAVLDEPQQQQMRSLLAEARRARAAEVRRDEKRPDNRPGPPRP